MKCIWRFQRFLDSRSIMKTREKYKKTIMNVNWLKIWNLENTYGNNICFLRQRFQGNGKVFLTLQTVWIFISILLVSKFACNFWNCPNITEIYQCKKPPFYCPCWANIWDLLICSQCTLCACYLTCFAGCQNHTIVYK